MTKANRQKIEYQVSVDTAVCDGCAICIFFCKPVVFEMSRELSSRGVFFAQALRPEECNNCRLCELACPQLAIAVMAGSSISSRGERP
jgi:2-oxoglutarate ferredoxin oxidoreductase subunit delta